jgi:hypothetical protein
MTNRKAALATVAIGCSVLACPAQAKAQAQTHAQPRPETAPLAGLTEPAASQVLQSAGWLLLRRATTGARAWSDWTHADGSRQVGLEQIDGKITAVIHERQPASSPNLQPASAY